MNKVKTTLSPALLLLMATATGIAVASNYYAQPLLHTISGVFNVSETVAGTIVTTAQFSYALGLLLLVPLGDIFERKRLIIIMMLLSTSGLVISAYSSSLYLLLLGTALAGLFSVVVQVLMPYAATLAEPAQRGRSVGVVMSGLLTGILLARTFAGVISTMAGWRMVYVAAAVLMALTTISLAIKLPPYPPSVKMSYPKLIGSIFFFLKELSIMRLRSTLGFLVFAVFAIFWTPLSFMLAERFGYSDMVIGMFGLAGAAGALVAPVAGKYADKGKSALMTSVGLVTIFFSWVAVYAGQYSIIALIIGILLIDVAIQMVHLINLNEVYKLQPEARNRLNAGYMFSYFLGGTLGSLTSAFFYEHYKWEGVAVWGIVVSFTALVVWQFNKNKY